MARRRRQSKELPGWVWMLFGLGIGLVVALGVYLNGPKIMGATDADPVAVQALSEPVAAPPAPEAIAPANEEPSPAASDEAVNEPAIAEDERAEDPSRFSFYDLLPSFEVVIPEVETPAARTEEVVAIDDPGVYMLQAGSFLTDEDAEAQRARLGLLGIESRVQRVTIDDRAFHRVRIGPIENLDELNSIRSRLRSADVDSMIMRVNP